MAAETLATSPFCLHLKRLQICILLLLLMLFSLASLNYDKPERSVKCFRNQSQLSQVCSHIAPPELPLFLLGSTQSMSKG